MTTLKKPRWWRGRSAVIGVPYAWLLLFFLAPFLIVAKYSVSEMGTITVQDVMTVAEGVVRLALKYSNFIFIATDGLYFRAYMNSLEYALVTTVLGLVGLLLAAVGLYGIVAYLVGQRTREIGVRMALGASHADVLRLVVLDGMRPVAIGMAIGLLLALGVTRLLMSFLLGVSPLDTVTFVAGAALLTAVALMASWLPARRAAAIDPVRALRAE